MDTYIARVSRIADLTHDVREIGLRIEGAQTIPFRPGQFFSFPIDRPGSRFGVTRAYTPVSSPDDEELTLLFNLVPDGPGSGYLFGLREGDETRFRGPFGTFTLPDAPHDLLFIASETGIAPFVSMLAWLSRHDAERRVTLLWELDTERDLYYQDALTRFAARMPNLTHAITLRVPSAGWQGRTGRLGALVEETPPLDGVDVFICGGSAMIAEAALIASAKGAETIHKEQYYRSAPPPGS